MVVRHNQYAIIINVIVIIFIIITFQSTKSFLHLPSCLRQSIFSQPVSLSRGREENTRQNEQVAAASELFASFS